MKFVIHVENISPPIPTRKCDWQAALDDYEGGDPLGHGETPYEAVVNLMYELEAHNE